MGKSFSALLPLLNKERTKNLSIEGRKDIVLFIVASFYEQFLTIFGCFIAKDARFICTFVRILLTYVLYFTLFSAPTYVGIYSLNYCYPRMYFYVLSVPLYGFYLSLYLCTLLYIVFCTYLCRYILLELLLPSDVLLCFSVPLEAPLWFNVLLYLVGTDMAVCQFYSCIIASY